MKNSRRKFLKQAGVAGLAASIVGPLAAYSNTDEKTKINSTAQSSSILQTDSW